MKGMHDGQFEHDIEKIFNFFWVLAALFSLAPVSVAVWWIWGHPTNLAESAIQIFFCAAFISVWVSMFQFYRVVKQIGLSPEGRKQLLSGPRPNDADELRALAVVSTIPVCSNNPSTVHVCHSLSMVNLRETSLEGYPRTYQMERNARRFHNGFAIFLPTFFLVMTVLHATGFMDHPIPLRQNLAMDSLALLFGLFISSRANRKVTLSTDAIEVRGWFSTRRLECGEILGRRVGQISARGGGGSFYIIVPANKNLRELKLPPYLNVDKFFFSWMSDIPKVAK
jgi:hypothetical protein